MTPSGQVYGKWWGRQHLVAEELARSWSSHVHWRKMKAWGTVQSQGKGDMLAACWAARLLFTWCEVRTHRTEMETNREGHRDQWGPNKETRETNCLRTEKGFRREF